MRSLKKTLTLALVFVMAIGLLSAGAVDFTDADDIQYTVPVEVMVNLGAINGYPDGTFNPDGLVTRAEAAKLVTYAILTPRVAEYLPKGTSSFDDVPANHWAAPYIEYCVSQGIVNGRGNGKFDPNGNVTAFELAKMLLTAAGYGKNNEYVGTSWSLNVVTDAIDNGLFTGTQATNYGAPATREEAALYVFNGLTNVDQVKYSKDTETYELTVANGQTIGEQKYGLELDPVVAPNGTNGFVWKSNDKEVSSFISAENVLYTSMDGTSFARLTNKNLPTYKVSLNEEVTYFYNGSEVPVYATETAYDEGSLVVNDNKVYSVDDAIDEGNKKTFAELLEDDADPVSLVVDPATKGVIVNFVDTDFDGLADKITVIKKSVAQLANDPVVTRSGNVRIPELGVPAGGADPKNVPGYEDLSAGDVVLYYTVGDVYHIEIAEAVYGKITAKRTVSSNVQIIFDGDAYLESGLTDGTLFSGITSADYNVDAVLYLDNNGYVVALDTDAVAQETAYAVLLAAKKIQGSGWQPTRYEALLLFMDGTTDIVKVAKIDDTEADKIGDIEATDVGFYTYTVNRAGEYELTAAVTEPEAKGNITPNRATFITGNVGNANTLFILNGDIVGKDNTYVVYKGISNVPALDNAETYILKDGSIAKYVYVYDGTLSAPEAKENLVYFVNVAEYTYYPGENAYNEYEAIVDGELTTVKVAADVDDVANGLFEVELTSGVITGVDAVKDNTVGTGTKGAANGVITVQDDDEEVYFIYDNNTIVYFISKDNDVTEATVAYIEDDDNDEYAVIVDNDNPELAVVVIIREVE